MRAAFDAIADGHAATPLFVAAAVTSLIDTHYDTLRCCRLLCFCQRATPVLLMLLRAISLRDIGLSAANIRSTLTLMPATPMPLCRRYLRATCFRHAPRHKAPLSRCRVAAFYAIPFTHYADTPRHADYC